MTEATPLEMNLTDRMAENHRRALQFGRETLLLVASANHCSGCETLAEQLGSSAVRDQLAGTTYVVEVKAGDLYSGVAERMRIGDWTFGLPGFPLSSCWTVEPEGLRFRSVAIGPLDPLNPLDGLTDLLAGRSIWVAEAEAARIPVCRDTFCTVLHANNGFFEEFLVPLPGDTR